MVPLEPVLARIWLADRIQAHHQRFTIADFAEIQKTMLELNIIRTNCVISFVLNYSRASEILNMIPFIILTTMLDLNSETETQIRHQLYRDFDFHGSNS